MLSAAQQNQVLQALEKQGLLKSEQVADILSRAKQQGTDIEEIITEENSIPSEKLAQAKATVLNVPYVNLRESKVDDTAMALIARKAALTYRVVPFAIEDGRLKVAMRSPDDFQAQEAVKFIARRKNLQPDIYVASGTSITEALGGASAVKAEIGGALDEFSREIEEVKDDVDTGTESLEKIMEEAPVTKVVAVMIRHAIEGQASDIHIEPSEKEVRIRYRIDGRLHTTLALPRKVHSAVISRIKILANLKIDEQRLPQDGRFSVTVDDKGYDFRVSIMPTTYGEKAALRILDKSAGAPTLEELGMSVPMREIFKKRIKAPHGIILISGPTGAGKSTTLFSGLSMLNAPDVNIVTLEDPVEYEIGGINQTQIHPSIGLTFASGLRSILRQDPDIVMVGEIRDKETAELAVHASLTGHLVLSTIHTNDAIGTIPRLADMGVDPFLLAASLRLLAAQRLVGRLCQHCKKEKRLSPSVKEKITQELAGIPEQYLTEENQRSPQVLFESTGCPECHEEGTSGRMAIFEIVPVSRKLRDNMNDELEYDTLKDIARAEGLVTMRQDGLLKALAGDIRLEDVIRVTSETESNS